MRKITLLWCCFFWLWWGREQTFLTICGTFCRGFWEKGSTLSNYMPRKNKNKRKSWLSGARWAMNLSSSTTRSPDNTKKDSKESRGHWVFEVLERLERGKAQKTQKTQIKRLESNDSKDSKDSNQTTLIKTQKTHKT